MASIEHLTASELTSLIEAGMSVLPGDFNIIPFTEYQYYIGEDAEVSLDDLTKGYLRTINIINEKVSSTVVPFFKTMELTENAFFHKYDLNDFDSDFNYIGMASPKTLKWLITEENFKNITSTTPYSDSSVMDFSSLFKAVQTRG